MMVRRKWVHGGRDSLCTVISHLTTNGSKSHETVNEIEGAVSNKRRCSTNNSIGVGNGKVVKVMWLYEEPVAYVIWQ